MLAKECDANTTGDWDKHVVKVEYALNNTVNRSTGFTPSMVLFGRNQKGTLCDRVEEFLGKKLEEKQANLNDVRAKAVENIEKSQAYNKAYYDKRHKQPQSYKRGDYIMIKNVITTPGISKKLFAKYRGPYEVKKDLPNDRYVITDIDGLQLTRLPYKGVSSPVNMRPFMVQSFDLDDDEKNESHKTNLLTNTAIFFFFESDQTQTFFF